MPFSQTLDVTGVDPLLGKLESRVLLMTAYFQAQSTAQKKQKTKKTLKTHNAESRIIISETSH